MFLRNMLRRQSGGGGGGGGPTDPLDVGESPSAGYRDPNYSVAAGIGTWIATAGTNLVQATLAPASTGAGGIAAGAPNFEGSVDNGLANAVAASTWFGAGDIDRSGYVIADTESIPDTDAVNVYNNAAFFADTGAEVGLHLYKVVGTPDTFWAVIYVFCTASGGVRKAVVQLPGEVGRVVIGWKVYDDGGGRKLYIRVNGGSWVTGDSTGAPDATTGTLRVGGRYDFALTFDGIIWEIGFYTVSKSDSAFDNIDAWAIQEY